MEMSHLKIKSKNTQQRREQMEMSHLKIGGWLWECGG